MKNNLIALLDQTYPGVNAPFDSPVREDGHQSGGDFAAAFWHLGCVRSMSLTAFTERYRKWCKRNKYNFSHDKAAEIHARAQDQIAMLPMDALTKMMIRQAIDALNAVSATLERLKAEALELASQLPEYPVVMEMCGVGNSLGPSRGPDFVRLRPGAASGGLTVHGGDWGCDPLCPQERHYLLRRC